MKVKDILEFLNKTAPFSTGESFDNIGLLIGKKLQKATNILIAVDLTRELVEKAVSEKNDLIITHHPYIFEPMKKIEDPLIIDLIKNDISYIALHTNYDHARLNDEFSKLLHLQNVTKIHEGDNGGFYGGIGVLNPPMKAEDYIDLLKREFNLTTVRTVGDREDNISKVAYGNGSTGDFIDETMSLDCDVYVTGEVKYHDAVSYHNKGFFVIELGHYESESFFAEDLKMLLEKEYPILKVQTYMLPILKRV